jgi:pimeloyl-ACP methyl ester carboxylesterase
MNPKHLIAFAAAALTLLVGGVAHASAAAGGYQEALAQYAGQELVWQECLPGEGFPFFECAFVIAPLDWSHPGGGDIQLAVSRVRATDHTHRRGILLSNPGGPGGSGLLLPLLGYLFEPDLAAVYDGIGMDVRGAGTSTRLDCVDQQILTASFGPDPRDRSPQNLEALADIDRAFADACSSDPLTPYITTDQTARDLDLVRAIFGEDKVSYVGYSAGTWLGAAYASLFPDRVDRFVLDSNVEFTSDWEDIFHNQPQAFQRRFDLDFLPWIAQYDELYHYGATATEANATYEARRAALASHALDLGDQTLLTPALYDAGIVYGLYHASNFPGMATALAAIEHWQVAGEDERVAARALFRRPLSFTIWSVYTAVTCNDTAWSTDFDRYVKESEQLGRKYPLVGWAWEDSTACPFWNLPFGRSPIEPKVIPPLLMINSERDPATPIEGARRAHTKTPGSVLLTVVDYGDHSIYGFAGNSCVDRIANAWLIDGVLPKHDLTCPGAPLPTPSTPAALEARSPANVANTAGYVVIAQALEAALP